MNESIFQLGIQARREFDEHVIECERLGEPIKWIAEERLAQLVAIQCLKLIKEQHRLALELDWDTDDVVYSIRETIEKYFDVNLKMLYNFTVD